MPVRDVENKSKWSKMKYDLIYYCIFLNPIKTLLPIIFISLDLNLFTVGFAPVKAHWIIVFTRCVFALKHRSRLEVKMVFE